MSPVELNIKAVVTATVAGLVALYVLYSLYPQKSSSSSHSMSGLKQHLTWKTKAMVDIPSEIKVRAKEIKIIERRETINIDGKDVLVYFREADPLSEPKFPILLLHGMAFTSATWVDTVQSQTDVSINTINLLAAAGHKVIAVDLPGFGNSKAEKSTYSADSASACAKFVTKLLETLHLERPVVISPSMSGKFSLAFVMGEDPSLCHERVRGFVPVAPGTSEDYKPEDYEKCHVPVMIVYGTKDVKLGLTSTNNLRNFANNEIFPMKDAKHPCYLDDPDKWHYNLYNFLLAVERDEGDQRQVPQ